ncbi:MAG: hypothetical protein WAT79_17030 [Saprospiraceae bacterium]
MGLHFAYKGKLKAATLLPELIYEVEDICHSLHWPVKVFEQIFPDNTFQDKVDDRSYGIFFSPPEFEAIGFVLNSEGRIWNPYLKEALSNGGSDEIKVITVQLNLDDENPEPVISENDKEVNWEEIVYQYSVKSNNPDASTYVQIIELIRYLSEKFFDEFSMQDDSGYWDKKDIHLLTKRLSTTSWLIEELHKKLSKKSFKDPEDFLQYMKQLGTFIKKNIKEEEE